MKIKLFNQINESYREFTQNYTDEIDDSIKLLIKLQDSNCNKDKIDKILSIYDDNVISKIEEWIYNTPTSEEISDFALKNQDKWGTEPKMILNAITDYAEACDIHEDDDEDSEFYEGSFQFDKNESKEEIDNFTSRYYDNYDDEDDNSYEEDLQNYAEKSTRKIQLYEKFKKNKS